MPDDNAEYRHWREIEDACNTRNLPLLAHWATELLIHRASLRDILPTILFTPVEKPRGKA